ncbi:cytochrome P450 [Microdochium trichocladiopsis]|uniref:Cytochrome P450 n=1 Tax=Microdochium trichocladiopsis TaxID=1682393 RepID=A0A9P9BG29_9PEZI|nr:cytochrome P450 [Microdochium trichocladiopsis]KAH7014234.1 cytochrome P450 [Microdochium trichocladiopsis]
MVFGAISREVHGVLFLTTTRFFIVPIVRYLCNAKGLRKYHNYSWLSPLTDLRHCYLSSQGRRSRDLTKAHVERGASILRIGPNALSFNHPDAIKDIYGHRTKCVKDVKESILAGTHRQLFDVIDKADHARKRKLLSAAFATKNLENWEYKVNYTSHRLVKVFDERCVKSAGAPRSKDDAVDFNHWINLWTIEAINFIALSSKMDLLDTGTDWVTAERLDGTCYRARYRHSQNHNAIVKSVFCWDYDLWPWIAWITQSVPSKWKQLWKISAPWGDITYHQASERLRRYKAGEQLDDFFSCLMNDKNGAPNYLEWGEIVAEVSAIIDAGAETTAIALSNIMELLIKHPAKLSALRDELSNVLDDDDVVAPFDKVKDLPYLKACLDEGLRLSPPTSSGLPRRTPPEGASILGEWIPGDTSVSMTIYGAHHDPSIYPDPDVFKPERWMDPAERKRMEPYFIPFSAGARGCIGRNISYLEQIVILATIVHRYDFALATPNFVAERFEAFNMICGPLPIIIWRRGPQW